MRLRTLAAAASLAMLLPGLTMTSAHAAAPAHRAAKVTLKNLPASSEVGKKVTVAGTAKGARVKVTVQRQYAGGSWQTVGTGRTSKKGKYAVKVKLTQGGTTSFRVKRAGGGTSKADSLAVYEWLDLAEQPKVIGANIANVGVTSTIGGRAFPQSIEAASDVNLAYSVASCTSFQVATGFRDSERTGLPAEARQRLTARLLNKTETPVAVSEFETPVGPAVLRTVPITAGAPYLYLSASYANVGDASVSAVLGTPQARCNASRLPAIRYADVYGGPA